jgi:hypothetical protein
LRGPINGGFVFITKLIKNEPQRSIPNKRKPLITLAGHGGSGSFRGFHEKRFIMELIVDNDFHGADAFGCRK